MIPIKRELSHLTNKPKCNNSYDDIEIFRLSNYTDCFGTIKHRSKFPEAIKQLIQENNGQIIPTTSVHVCDYRFVLNERLFPEPVYANEKGLCCCLKCCQPLYTILDKNRKIKSYDGAVKDFSKANAKEFNHGVIVYEILYGMHKDIDYNNQYTKPDYVNTKKHKHHNSFALRFQ